MGQRSANHHEASPCDRWVSPAMNIGMMPSGSTSAAFVSSLNPGPAAARAETSSGMAGLPRGGSNQVIPFRHTDPCHGRVYEAQRCRTTFCGS